MKKVLGSLAVLALVAGCSSEQKNATNLVQVTEYLNSGVCQVVATGEQNDVVLKCAPNAVFDEAFAADKTAQFLSAQIDLVAAAADTEAVYLNIVPDGKCPIRVLVPGSDVEGLYATQICVPEMPAEAPAPAETADAETPAAEAEAPVAE